ncbi:hypothetical protein [Amycolatopsis sp. NPDC059657]|uniref:hypothetical protein n=1 Tax=Amycolatopsis sp. NPDC059657 TaxID=3346899 RepID=UPI00366ACA0D
MTAPEPGGASTEPVRIAEGVRALLVAIIATGWVAIPDNTINVIISAVSFALSILSSVLVRRKVVPLAKLGPDGVPVITRLPANEPPLT